MECNSLLSTDKELAELYQRRADLVYRLCFIYLKNPVDVEDAVQSVFLKLIKSPMPFNDHEHEKAWLMVTTRNYCKDVLKNWWTTRRVAVDTLPEVVSWNGDEPSGKMVTKLLSLPEKYKTVLYLYYSEAANASRWIWEGILLSNKNIYQIFEALTPRTEQKVKALHNILMQSQVEYKRQRRLPRVKLVRYAVLAAMLMVSLTTTAFAAVYMGIDEAFIKFLKPSNNDQAVYLSNGAYVVDKTIKNEYGSLTLKQVIGDSNLTYILMDFTAPEGTVLNASRYRFIP